MSSELESDAELKQALESSGTIAVLGASSKPEKPAHYVPAYLDERGYRVIPVNPGHTGEELFGEQVRPRLDAIDAAVDIVDVFRRPEALDDHLEEILAMRPRPKVVWLQQGIRNQAFADALIAERIQVVQDRCAKQEHSRLLDG